MTERGDAVPIDVHDLARRTVATLYSHLVTRPTGHAVRLAIESQIADQPRGQRPIVSLVDLSEVTLLDFSCADEVVAKLLVRYLDRDRPRNVFFVFKGVGTGHRSAIEAVLERRNVAAVVVAEDGHDLVGPVSMRERRVWRKMQSLGAVTPAEAQANLDAEELRTLHTLCDRRLVCGAPGTGYRALETLLPGGAAE